MFLNYYQQQFVTLIYLHTYSSYKINYMTHNGLHKTISKLNEPWIQYLFE